MDERRLQQRQLNKGIEIIKLALCGYANEEICTKLGISAGAVKARLRALNYQIGARNRAHALALLLINGKITFNDLDHALDTIRFGNEDVD